jgi:hypothetical protein
MFGCLAQPTTRSVSYKLIVFGCLTQLEFLAEASQIYFWAWLRRNVAFELRSAAWLTWPLGFGDASDAPPVTLVTLATLLRRLSDEAADARVWRRLSRLSRLSRHSRHSSDASLRRTRRR